jgi:hypothetical protein
MAGGRETESMTLRKTIAAAKAVAHDRCWACQSRPGYVLVTPFPHTCDGDLNVLRDALLAVTAASGWCLTCTDHNRTCSARGCCPVRVIERLLTVAKGRDRG